MTLSLWYDPGPGIPWSPVPEPRAGGCPADPRMIGRETSKGRDDGKESKGKGKDSEGRHGMQVKEGKGAMQKESRRGKGYRKKSTAPKEGVFKVGGG